MVDVVEEDLDVAIKYLKNDAFDKVNILGNRILSNLAVENRRNLMIIGWMLKQISIELSKIKKSESEDFDSIKKASIEHLENLKKLAQSDNTSPKDFWIAFFDVEENIRKSLLPKEEKDYTTEEEFSSKAMIFLLNILKENQNDIYRNFRCRIVDTVTLDLARITNEHGGRLSLVAFLTLFAFQSYYKYVFFESRNEKGQIISEENMKRSLKTYLKEICEITDLIAASEEDELYEKANGILGELGIDYRKMFFKYGELYSIVVSSERQKEVGSVEMSTFEETEEVLKTKFDKAIGK